MVDIGVNSICMLLLREMECDDTFSLSNSIWYILTVNSIWRIDVTVAPQNREIIYLHNTKQIFE